MPEKDNHRTNSLLRKKHFVAAVITTHTIVEIGDTTIKIADITIEIVNRTIQIFEIEEGLNSKRV